MMQGRAGSCRADRAEDRRRGIEDIMRGREGAKLTTTETWRKVRMGIFFYRPSLETRRGQQSMDNGDGKRVDHSRASQAPASQPSGRVLVSGHWSLVAGRWQQLATPGADAGTVADQRCSWHWAVGTGQLAVGSWQVHATVARHCRTPCHDNFPMLHVAAQAPPTIAKYSSHHHDSRFTNAPPTISKCSSHHCKGLLPASHRSLPCPSSIGSLAGSAARGSLFSRFPRRPCPRGIRAAELGLCFCAGYRLHAGGLD